MDDISLGAYAKFHYFRFLRPSQCADSALRSAIIEEVCASHVFHSSISWGRMYWGLEAEGPVCGSSSCIGALGNGCSAARLYGHSGVACADELLQALHFFCDRGTVRAWARGPFLRFDPFRVICPPAAVANFVERHCNQQRELNQSTARSGRRIQGA